MVVRIDWWPTLALLTVLYALALGLWIRLFRQLCRACGHEVALHEPSCTAWVPPGHPRAAADSRFATEAERAADRRCTCAGSVGR